MRRDVHHQVDVRRAKICRSWPIHKLDAAYRFVAAQVKIGGIGAYSPHRGRRHPGKRGLFEPVDDGGHAGSCCDRSIAVALALLVALDRPGTGQDEIRFLCRPHAQQVHRDDRILGGGAALHEHHRIIIRHAEQRPQILLSLGAYLHELASPVAHFHHGHAAAMPIQHFSRGLRQNRLGKRGGTGRKIPGSRHDVRPQVWIRLPGQRAKACPDRNPARLRRQARPDRRRRRFPPRDAHPKACCRHPR